MKIGEAIRKIRKERTPYIKQGDMADALGITQSYLSQIECGRTPNINVLESIAAYLGLSLVGLLWYCLDERDVEESKRAVYRMLKPAVDELVKEFL